MIINNTFFLDTHAYLKKIASDIIIPKIGNLNEDEVFSGLFWVGKKGVELGLADGVGSINEVIKEKFGKKAKIKIIDQKKSFLQKRLSSSINSNDIFNRLEEMIMWSRYGL